MLKIQIELYIPSPNVSFETFIGEYITIRRGILHSLIDVLTHDVPELSTASNTQLRKIANKHLVFKMNTVRKGSWELVAISVPIIYYIGRIIEKVSISTLSKNKNYEEFQKLINQWLDQLILDKLLGKLRKKLDGKEKYERVLIERKKDDPFNELVKVRVELKKKKKTYILEDEEAKEYLKCLFEEKEKDA
ncbi:hypothetical protein [Vreelandella janggokensis]|uniref:hypothetical protein n=1 Tax=Vreelandella janggokensis TaxID=370767 RepID=UPI00285B92FB|nr:hypothetical protein [Halomonas janggokensis]MDR5886308.1 hypothetical protein [Halomonas janggokensis]